MKHLMIAMVLASMLIGTGASPVYAGEQYLPPLPDWPIIGPILRWLGVDAPEPPEESPTFDPSLPEYRIESMDSINALNEDEFEVQKRVRFIITEAAANQIVSQAIEDNDLSGAEASFSFAPNALHATARADRRLLEGLGLDLPRFGGATLRAEATLDFVASNCMVSVKIDKLKLNGLSIGLRRAGERIANEAIPQYWPEQICVERVVVRQGEIVIEGYRAQ